MSWIRQLAFGVLLYQLTCFYKEGGFSSSLGSRLLFIFLIISFLLFNYINFHFNQIRRQLDEAPQRIIIHKGLPERREPMKLRHDEEEDLFNIG